MSRIKHLVCLFLLATLFVACSKEPVVMLSEQAPAEGWSRSWQPEFPFTITDTLTAFNTFIDIRHTGEYPYSNLYLFLDLYKDEERIGRDTVECPLAAPDGRWLGKGLGFIHEDRFKAHVLYGFNKRFPSAGNYTIKLEQAMRRETLEGVVDVGISVEIVDP